MLEEILLQLLMLSLVGNVALAIISFILIIVLTVIIYKKITSLLANRDRFLNYMI